MWIWPAIGGAMVAFVVLAACSNDKEAVDMNGRLSRAATAVDVARSMEASRFAAPELAAAEEKLVRARRAAREEEYEEADRLLTEMLADINFATAKADAARIRAQVEQMKAADAPKPRPR